MARETAPETARDLVLLLQSCSAALGDRVLADVRGKAGQAVRFNDGYVFQHLVRGPLSVTELARRLGVSQQAASKQVADLESRDLVRRRPDPADGRSNLVELSRRAWRAIEAARGSRAAIAEELAGVIGARQMKAVLDGLTRISDHAGAGELLNRRRLRPESDR